MNRRTFIGGSIALGTLAMPNATTAQPGRKIARIGILSFAGTAAEITGPDPGRPSVKALLIGLQKLGYIYGRDFVTVPRGGGGRPGLWPAQGADLVGSSGDVIVAPGPLCLQ